MLKDLSDEAKVTVRKFIGSDIEAAEHYVLSPKFYEFGESGLGTDAFGIVTGEDEHLSCGH